MLMLNFNYDEKSQYIWLKTKYLQIAAVEEPNKIMLKEANSNVICSVV